MHTIKKLIVCLARVIIIAGKMLDDKDFSKSMYDLWKQGEFI